MRAIPIATHDPRSPRVTIDIAPADLLRSLYVVGKTGTGKSALLERVLLGAVDAGFGACLIDPHGDLATRVLGLLPTRHWNRVAMVRPSDAERAIGLAALDPGGSRALVASSVVEVFRKLWGETLFGPRSEHLLRHAILALLETPGASLLGLTRLLTDADYRLRLVGRVTDPVVRSYWLKEFPGLGKAFTAEVTSPVLNKLGALTAPAVRRVVGQVSPRLHVREVMDAGGIIVCDLSGVGRDAAAIIGALLVSSIEIAAHSRAALPPFARRPFLLAADEFQSYLTGSFVNLLAEGRKYGLCAALAHQHAAQLTPEVRAAIVGNVGALAAFRLGADDAKLLAPELEPEVTVRDLVSLRRYHLALRLLRDGQPLRPVICQSLPPPPAPPVPETLLHITTMRYGRRVALVDREIAEQLGARAAA